MFWRIVLFFTLSSIAACAAQSPLELEASRGPSSFLGVKFGRSLAEVQKLHPLGSTETSPYGADAFRLTDAVAGEAKYDSVIYEFAPRHGMQMVLVRFAPESRDLIFDGLRKTLGAPDKATATDTAEGPSATWKATNGASAEFDGPNHWFILVGPYGKPLEVDISLRSQLQDYY
jgi:hypothetical protein